LILPAINGVKAVLSAAAKTNIVKRVVLTSSFASVLDATREVGQGFTYTGEHWNPLTYSESIAPGTSPIVAYRGSKKFAELEAWNFVKSQNPSFDLVAFCPPMTFGPIVHPVSRAEELNESNARLWEIAEGKPLPIARVPVWIDVRDLACAHVEALERKEAGNKRYVPAASEKFSYELAASILRKHFPCARNKIASVDAKPPTGYDLDGAKVGQDLDIKYHSFEEAVVDLFNGLSDLGMVPWK
jgi:nucleoside-diphosphate-sugar epimerase